MSVKLYALIRLISPVNGAYNCRCQYIIRYWRVIIEKDCKLNNIGSHINNSVAFGVS